MSDAATPPEVIVTTTTVTRPVPEPTPPDELTVTVSAKDLYDGIMRVETKLDALPTIDHENRIRALERWRYAAGGGLALGVTAIGWLLQAKGGG